MLDKHTGVTYVKPGYYKGAREDRPVGAGKPVGLRAGVRMAGSVSILAGQ